jgi:uncharacterized protein YyaL (SSP411 family)
MLYDNSQLARVYLHAWQVTGNEFFRTVTEEILDYVAREMLDPDGGFYSTQDADSEGKEGKFFVWTPDEIREVLGDDAEAFTAAYGVSPGGNLESKNILEFVADTVCRHRSPGPGSDAAHDEPVSIGLWSVAPGAGICPFKAAGDSHHRRP